MLAAMLWGGQMSFAQFDSRNRTPETVVTDGLAQLPAKTPEKYNEIVSEMAGTGSKGIEMLAGMLKPADKNQNAVFEYAIDAIVNHATMTKDAALRQQIHDGLVAGIKNCTDNANKAFLLSELNKIAEAGDAQLYASFLGDAYLRHAAINGLALVPGDNALILQLISSAPQPDADLAYVAAFKKLSAAEPTLIKWTASNDPAVLRAVYDALAECGSSASVTALRKAAKNVKFAEEKTGATDSYLRLLKRVGGKDAVTAAKELTGCKQEHARCAGLNILLNNDKANAEKNILSALKDKDIAYRNTALLHAWDTAGDGIFNAVAAKYGSLSPAAKIDVLNWFGNNETKAQLDLITEETENKETSVAIAAINAASKIGGDKALVALTSALSKEGAIAEAGKNALLSFNGDIKSGVLAALDSSDPKVVKQALKLASTRHIHAAYPKTMALAVNGDATVKETALESLKGVVRPENFNDICKALEAAGDSKTIAELQAAAKNAIVSLNPDKQYSQINANGRLEKRSTKTALYYPLLAQAATPQAIAKLLEAYNANQNIDAYNALLTVNSTDIIPVLYDIAAKNPAQKDDALLRYFELARNAGYPAIEQYELYSKALELNPSAKVKNLLLYGLSLSRTLPSVMLAAKYLDNKETALEAATTVKNILNKEDGLRKGADIKKILEKAHKVFVDFGVNDADAGYASDEVAGMLKTFDNEGGYTTVAGKGPEGEFENFDLYFDWNGTTPLTLTMRSTPLVVLDPAKGICVNGQTKELPANATTVHARMVNDRLFVAVGPTEYAVNEIVTTPDKGSVSVDNAEAVENFYFNSLPDTPVFVLPADEAAQGFEVLFDGRSLNKWHGNTTAYVPVDGNIYVTAQYGGSGNLYTKKNYSDFIFRFEFFFDVPAVNNGIGIRTGKDVTGVDAAFDGMEIQVLDHDDPVYQGHPYGYKGIQPYQIHGSIYGVVGAKHLDFGPIKQWHTEEIKAVGDHVTVTVDGQVIVDADIREACQGHAVAPDGGKVNPYMIDHRNHPGLFNKEGYISFCGHGPGVKFRNVRVLDLSKQNKNKKSKKK